jgi:hypothetical protein
MASSDATVSAEDARAFDGSDAYPPPPPIDGSTLIDDLTSIQKGELCDWYYVDLGVGYGSTVSCGATTVLNRADQGDCVSDLNFTSLCMVTVSQVETCDLQKAPSRGCDLPSSCVTLLQCAAGPDGG